MPRIQCDDLSANPLADDIVIDSPTVFFTMQENAVVFHNFFGQDVCFDETNLRQAIANIKARHYVYFTEKAWQQDLSIYNAGLAYLLVNQER